MTAKKKIKDYIKKSVRSIKHRKGLGVHSPYAFAIITEVIEEKCPYYSYQLMSRTYGHNSPISYKVACLLLRLANRFKAHQILEVRCNGGYTALPFIFADSQNAITSVAGDFERLASINRLNWLKNRQQQVSYVASLNELSEDYRPDMIVITDMPQGISTDELFTWIMSHVHENTSIFIKGIRAHHPLEDLWDKLCDCDDVAITMDLFDYGLAIRRPRFFKQHYIVSF